MTTDYRNSEYCMKLENVLEKKEALQQKIKGEHPRAKVYYNFVKKMGSDYNKEFRKIYNYKCSYCGNSIANIPSQMLETDHFVCESSFDSNAAAGEVSNLVLSCYECNRGKGKLLIEGNYLNILSPDLSDIKNVFLRDEDYKILIKTKYAKDEKVNEFYKSLKFDYESKRLDHLLLNMSGLLKKTMEFEVSGELAKLILFLQKKRNLL